MRLSCIRGDPGFAAYKRTISGRQAVYIFVDGAPQMYVITADEELGEVLRFVQGEDGRPVVNRDKDDFETETVRGRVHIDIVALLQ